MIIIVATFGQAISGESPTVSVLGAIIVWRFIMGIGIGGDYPLSAVISSEFASTASRGRLMTAVFAFQGWGNLGSSVLYFSTLPYPIREICSCLPCLTRSCPCVQNQNLPRQLRRAQTRRLLLAYTYRHGLYSRLRCLVFPTHDS